MLQCTGSDISLLITLLTQDVENRKPRGVQYKHGVSNRTTVFILCLFWFRLAMAPHSGRWAGNRRYWCHYDVSNIIAVKMGGRIV